MTLHMDDGIFQNREAVILHEAMIAANQQEIKVSKDATLNNMVNNVFLKNFDSVDALTIKGHSALTGAPATARLTDYGFEFFGDITEIARIRNARCVYVGRTVDFTKEG